MWYNEAGHPRSSPRRFATNLLWYNVDKPPPLTNRVSIFACVMPKLRDVVVCLSMTIIKSR
ncbi:MAG: hypothetical protein LBQ66_14075 [Planctomycetaceae bacterium]|nr:hypothetical protein [Planctomycetaceae bacterium]